MKIVEKFKLSTLKKNIDTGTKEQRTAVIDILAQVQANGDQAVAHYTHKFDGVQLADYKVTRAEIEQAYEEVSPELIQDMQEARENIRDYHEQQYRTSWMTTSESGTILGQIVRPIERVGAYVPGGTAAYPSSLLMAVIPAQVAGVKEIVLVTPPSASGSVTAGVLIAADILGITEIYKVGGAQAIGALAYGTETITAVDKIVGPGNVFVALAKREVFGLVDIDMVAGPTDVLIIADEYQNPAFVAADLLSQAEHDPLSSAICVTTSKELANHVQQAVQQQLKDLPRKDIAQKSIDNHSVIYVVDSLQQAVDVANQIAPEHLELLVETPIELLGKIKHAGAIFLGEYSSEPVGDYFAGPSHVLPTNGTARFSSCLNVDDFLKKSSVISYSRSDFNQNSEKIMRLARYEGLEGHARAIQIRLEHEKRK